MPKRFTFFKREWIITVLTVLVIGSWFSTTVMVNNNLPRVASLHTVGLGHKYNQSCINRMTDCQGSFEYSDGHHKYRTSSNYLYKSKPVDYYVQFNEQRTFDTSVDCLVNLDPYTLHPSALTGDEVRWFKHNLIRANATTYQYKDTIRIFRYALAYYHLYALTYDNSAPFFLELGAYDGIWASNTHALEVCLNWNGLLIDGNARMYTKLMDNRPFIHKLLLVPGCANDNETIEFASSIWASSGLEDIVGNRGAHKDSVHCGPLALYLQDLRIESINYFSLDVEGSEMSVLNTIDFDQVKIDILQIETRNRLCGQSCNKSQEIEHLLVEKHGYNVLRFYAARDDLYIHPKSKLCVFILDRIEYVSKNNTNVSFADQYLYENYGHIQKMCSFKYGRFFGEEIVETFKNMSRKRKF